MTTATAQDLMACLVFIVTVQADAEPTAADLAWWHGVLDRTADDACPECDFGTLHNGPYEWETGVQYVGCDRCGYTS